MNKLIYICIFLLINSCATYTLIEKDEQIKVNDLYAFKAKISLSEIRMKQGSKLRVFTNNGQGLESFFFSTDVYPALLYQKNLVKSSKNIEKI